MRRQRETETFQVEETPAAETAKVQRLRRQRAELDVLDGPAFYIEAMFGVKVESFAEAVRFFRKRGIRAEDIKASAMLLWSANFMLGMNGNQKACAYGLDRAFGVPDRPFADQVEEMNLSEVHAEIGKLLTGSGVPDALTETALTRLQQRFEPLEGD
jgi:hypothetical protein